MRCNNTTPPIHISLAQHPKKGGRGCDLSQPCKSIQESSEEVMFFKTWQISQQMYLSRFKMWSSIALSIEDYKNQIFKYDFTHIHVYLYRVSFLTSLYIYKDYFKSCLIWWNLMQRFYASILWAETYILVHLSLEEATTFVCRRVLQLKSFLIFIAWMNWRIL